MRWIESIGSVATPCRVCYYTIMMSLLSITPFRRFLFRRFIKWLEKAPSLAIYQMNSGAILCFVQNSLFEYIEI